MSTRRGGWMQTFSGVAFWPLDPRADELRLVDIAHALSNVCRFAGHCREFYSVAQHSVLVASLVEPAVRPFALLHDAGEAYFGDLVRPIKSSPGMEAMERGERRVRNLVFETFCGRYPASYEWDEVKHADLVALATEARDLMAQPPQPWDPLPAPLDTTLTPLPPREAYQQFMDTCAMLGVVEVRR